MADTTSPQQTPSLNSFSLDSVLGTIWNSAQNIFNGSIQSLEHYWNAATTSTVATATAAADAVRQEQLNGGQNSPATPINTNTLLLLGMAAVALVVIARK